MRKLKLQVHMSIDGYITGPNNEQDWMVFFGDEKLKEYEFRLLESAETILLGRKMTNEFISYWTEVLNKPNDSWYTFAKKLIETPKIVFTKTLTKSEWPNTEIATGDLNEEITKLKSQEGSGGDIIVYGGASFDSSLIKENLIDEYYLFINPVAIGNGKTIFKDLKEIRKLSLVESIAFDSGTVLLHYKVKKINDNT
jgi:dihydrofolate reductase